MPNITTTKSLVVKPNAAPSAVFEVSPNAVAIVIQDQGVTTVMVHTPQEAVEMGVAMIQAAQEAARLALAKTSPLVALANANGGGSGAQKLQ